MVDGLRKTLSHASVYGVGTAIRNLTGIVMLPIYTRYLSPADYGVVELLQLAVDLTTMVFGMRITAGVFRFYFNAETEKEKRHVLAGAVYASTGLNLLGALFIVIFSDPLSRALFGDTSLATLLSAFAFTMVFLGATSVPLQYIRAIQRPWLYVGVSTFKLVLQVALNVYFIVIKDLGVPGFVYASVTTGLVFSGVLCTWLLAREGMRTSIGIYNHLLAFSWPLMFAGIAGFYITFGDRIFLRKFWDLSEVGIYALAYRFGFVLTGIVWQTFDQIWSTQQYQVFKDESSHHLFGRAFIWLSFGLIAGALGLALLAPEFLWLMSDPAFWAAADIVPFLALAYVFQPLSNFCAFSLYQYKKTRLVMQTDFLVVVVISVGYIALIPGLGGVGAALATLIAMFVRMIWLNRHSKMYFDMQLPWRKFWSLVASAVVVFLVSLLLLPGLGLVGAVMKMILMALFVAVVFFSPVIGPYERRATFRLLSDIGARLRSSAS